LVAVWAGVAAAERIPDAKSPIVPPTPEWQAAMAKAAPAKPTIQAAKRKLLVFSRFTGYGHQVIPRVNRVFEILGAKSGAFEATVSLEIEAFTPESLATYDVLVLNNNCSKGPRRNLFLDILETDAKYQGLTAAERETKAKAFEQSVLDFVAGGKGLVVVHGAPTMLNNSAKYTEMVGGAFYYHPPNQELTVHTVDARHPLVAAFQGKEPFIHRDEPYCFNGPYGQLNFHVALLSTASINAFEARDRACNHPRPYRWIVTAASTGAAVAPVVRNTIFWTFTLRSSTPNRFRCQRLPWSTDWTSTASGGKAHSSMVRPVTKGTICS
jgi:type 1 glutamine amidotransferase